MAKEQNDLIADVDTDVDTEVNHGDSGLGPGHGLETWDDRKRKVPKDWNPKRRAPRNHGGKVAVGDLVTFNNFPHPVYATGDQKGQPKDLDHPWQKTLPAVIARIIDPDSGKVDLRVLTNDEDGVERVIFIQGVAFDPKNKKCRSWC